MVNIKLDLDYSLLSDSKQWILGKRGKNRIDHVGFYTTIEEVIKSYLELKMKGSNATSIKSLMEYNKSTLTALSKALHPFDIQVETGKDAPKLEKSKQGELRAN